MTAQRVQDMTLDELTQLIDARIQRIVYRRTDTRTMEEVNASIRRNRIIPPPGAKSALEMLREDRDA